MIINGTTLLGIDEALNMAFKGGLGRATPNHEAITHVIPSTTGTEVYAWLDGIRGIRKRDGDDEYENVVKKEYRLTNEDWGGKLSIPRNAIRDDQYGLYSTVADELGEDARKHPGRLVFDLVNKGHQNPCYDGKNFFAPDHPLGNGVTFSNDLGGALDAWYLVDASGITRPLILQMREGYEFYMATNVSDENVRRHKVFEWEASASYTGGYGRPEKMFKSRLPLNEGNLDDAITAMGDLTDKHGKPLDIIPTHLLVPTALKLEANKLVEAMTVSTGGQNMQAGTLIPLASNFVRTI